MTAQLAARMLAAADTAEEVGALFGYPNPADIRWSADELRHEARQLAAQAVGQ